MVQQPRMYRRTIGTRYQVRFERYAMFAGTAIPTWILTGTAWHPPDGWKVEERFLFDVQYDREDEYDDGDEDADSPEEADECVEERHIKMILLLRYGITIELDECVGRIGTNGGDGGDGGR